MKHWNYGNDDIVLSNLKGLCHSNPSIGLIPSEKVVFNTTPIGEKVCLISGGGAGHEPLHGGFVGTNLLDAAVSGSIFASPSTRQIMSAVHHKSTKKNGTLVIVKNYTGDILHFGLVVERAKSQGYNIEMLVVGDDVAVGRKQNEMVGRRGLAGTALVHKIMGGASVLGYDLAKLVCLGRTINDCLVTVGASLDRTSVPGKQGEIEFNGPNEAELGLGIHNEPGTKLNPIPSIENLINLMFEKLVGEDKDRHYVDFSPTDDTVLLVNNIGGTSSLEMYAITEHVMRKFPLKTKPKRILVGDFVTSLNAPGFSITLLNLTKVKEPILELLDMPTNAPGWRPKVYESWDSETTIVESAIHHTQIKSDLKFDGGWFQQSLTKALTNVIEQEPKITHYDTLVGDGDCGETLAAGANAILDSYRQNQISGDDPVAVLGQITDLVEDSMGGTSGGIYSIFLTALCHQLQLQTSTSVNSVGEALSKALYDGLFKYTKARVGGRTLVDTLQPFVDVLHETGDVHKALEAARNGCNDTKKLQAKFGRASYVNEEEFKAEGGIPDPGAVGVLAFLEGFFASTSS